MKQHTRMSNFKEAKGGMCVQDYNKLTMRQFVNSICSGSTRNSRNTMRLVQR